MREFWLNVYRKQPVYLAQRHPDGWRAHRSAMQRERTFGRPLYRIHVKMKATA